MTNHDINKLVSLKENFTGQKFQWVKTDRPELLGKVVTCRDINPASNGRFYAYFDDGSKIDTVDLNRNLMMIHGDMQPLSKQEVMAIYQLKMIPPSSQASPLGENQQGPNISPMNQSRLGNAPTPETTVQNVAPAPQVAPKTNMFTMFNSEDSQISLSLMVKLPERKLLKMMYVNAENKEKFLSELSEYVQSMINNKVIRESLEQILAPNGKPLAKKDPEPEIKVREL